MLKVEGAAKKIVAAGRLADTDPQSAMKILGYASRHAFKAFYDTFEGTGWKYHPSPTDFRLILRPCSLCLQLSTYIHPLRGDSCKHS